MFKSLLESCNYQCYPTGCGGLMSDVCGVGCTIDTDVLTMVFHVETAV